MRDDLGVDGLGIAGKNHSMQVAARPFHTAACIALLGACLGPEAASSGADNGTSSSAARSARALEEAMPALGACVESALILRNEFNQVDDPDLQFEGIVVGVGAGVPGEIDTGHCPFGGDQTQGFGDGVQSSDNAPQLAQVSWLRLQRADGALAVLAVVASGFAFPNQVGDTLRFNLHTEEPTFSPVASWLEVRDADGGLVVWIATAGSVAGLTTPEELQLAPGAVQFERSGQCIAAWTENRLQATFGGTEASIPHRGSVALGAWQVTNGGVVIQTGSSTCTDAFAASARAAAWPSAASVPLTGGIGGPCHPSLFGPPYQVDPNLVCARDSQFPLGHLTLACREAADCPADSRCDGAFCRAPCSSEHDCPIPME